MHPDPMVLRPSLDVCGSLVASLLLCRRHKIFSFLSSIPFFLALFIWADTLSNKTVILRVDNEALVHVINSQTSKDSQVMFIIRELVLLCLCRNIQVKAVHIKGVENKLADALSRFRFDEFFDLFPDAIERPVPIPDLPHTVDFKTQSNFSTQMH